MRFTAWILKFDASAPRKRSGLKFGVWSLKFLLLLLLNASAQQSLPVTIRIDAAHPRAPLPPIWRFFGADEPNYATMKDGRNLLGQIGQLSPGHAYFRAHNLLTS